MFVSVSEFFYKKNSEIIWFFYSPPYIPKFDSCVCNIKTHR